MSGGRPSVGRGSGPRRSSTRRSSVGWRLSSGGAADPVRPRSQPGAGHSPGRRGPGAPRSPVPGCPGPGRPPLSYGRPGRIGPGSGQRSPPSRSGAGRPSAGRGCCRSHPSARPAVPSGAYSGRAGRSWLRGCRAASSGSGSQPGSPRSGPGAAGCPAVSGRAQCPAAGRSRRGSDSRPPCQPAARSRSTVHSGPCCSGRAWSARRPVNWSPGCGCPGSAARRSVQPRRPSGSACWSVRSRRRSRVGRPSPVPRRSAVGCGASAERAERRSSQLRRPSGAARRSSVTGPPGYASPAAGLTGCTSARPTTARARAAAGGAGRAPMSPG
ncbi:hypothetical protein GA0074704_4648 [Micromonospora siamensis]|uniref:Uncharacterized protein n=1 Tax=Micromonospora siamensis TaxID=299152 RepID=A0A1C5JLS3_9ACTN|nr:hypothetical protein GA0074704_4648 [Micromonospora siamensis]